MITLKQNNINDGVGFLLIVLFLYSSVIKVISFQKFITELHKSPLFPNFLVLFIGICTILAEALIVLLLATRHKKLWGYYASFFLMLTFSLYLIVLTTAFVNVPCSCGGILGGMSYPVHIAFNIFFTFVALVGIYTCEDPKAVKTEIIVNEA